MFTAEHLSPAAITGRIGDFIDFESIGKLAFVFFDGNVTKLVIDEKRVVLAGGDAEIDNDDAGITVNHQVAGIVTVKEAYPMQGTIIADIGPGKLAHV